MRVARARRLGNRIVRPEDFERARVARRSRVAQHDVVEGGVLFAEAAEADAEDHGGVWGRGVDGGWGAGAGGGRFGMFLDRGFAIT